MANSDNVLRGGLTRKHVDVPGLMRILTFDSDIPRVLVGEPAGGSEWVYRTPSKEFELSRIDLAPSVQYLGRATDGPIRSSYSMAPQLLLRAARATHSPEAP
jgi:mannose-6-phosphate isomerase